MTPRRLEAFSDGVFAVGITLLAIDLKIPPVADGDLERALWASTPRVLTFVLSFLIVGVYWVAHHSMLDFWRRVDRTGLWLNNLTLMFVCVLPYPASVLAAHPR